MSVPNAAHGDETPPALDLRLPEQPRLDGWNLIIPLSEFRRTDTLRRAIEAITPFIPPPVSEVPYEYVDTGRYRMYVRDQAREQTMITVATIVAALLVDAMKEVPFGCGVPTLDADGWVERAARRYGAPSDFPTWNQPQAPKNLNPEKIPAGHLKLHRIAERDGGWHCAHCGIGLIDVCTDDDIEYDQKGHRYVKPGSHRVMATVDHQVPQSLNGSHQVRNLVLSCQPCNSSRGARV